MKWNVFSGLPFTTIQNKHLLEAFKLAYPDARFWRKSKRRPDYAYAEENIPAIRVIGWHAFHNPALKQEIDEDDGLLAEVNWGNDAGEDLSDEEEDADENSPVDKVHLLAIYVHASPRRRDESERFRAELDPDTPQGILPLKDIKLDGTLEKR
ncbi:hypothetical protein QFC22_006531 [Naganishia vaughanmartiniae]|uniref:Uncharacterized protein n=1 Tax=Naganishia vaughanmartiniae TaxID=1424756 RepID=A0ACC2WIM1_9TREE|nr:hypothetical protein QFC22_006531 [Naganishia vaughanmartiniae]